MWIQYVKRSRKDRSGYPRRCPGPSGGCRPTRCRRADPPTVSTPPPARGPRGLRDRRGDPGVGSLLPRRWWWSKPSWRGRIASPGCSGISSGSLSPSMPSGWSWSGLAYPGGGSAGNNLPWKKRSIPIWNSIFVPLTSSDPMSHDWRVARAMMMNQGWSGGRVLWVLLLDSKAGDASRGVRTPDRGTTHAAKVAHVDVGLPRPVLLRDAHGGFCGRTRSLG